MWSESINNVKWGHEWEDGGDTRYRRAAGRFREINLNLRFEGWKLHIYKAWKAREMSSRAKSCAPITRNPDIQSLCESRRWLVGLFLRWWLVEGGNIPHHISVYSEPIQTGILRPSPVVLDNQHHNSKVHA